jgi:hypothetical protein
MIERLIVSFVVIDLTESPPKVLTLILYELFKSHVRSLTTQFAT